MSDTSERKEPEVIKVTTISRSAKVTKSPTESGNQKKKRKYSYGAIAYSLAKWIGIPVLLVVALLGGMHFGYSVVGNEPAEDVWNLTAIRHMIALVFGK